VAQVPQGPGSADRSPPLPERRTPPVGPARGQRTPPVSPSHAALPPGRPPPGQVRPPSHRRRRAVQRRQPRGSCCAYPSCRRPGRAPSSSHSATPSNRTPRGLRRSTRRSPSEPRPSLGALGRGTFGTTRRDHRERWKRGRHFRFVGRAGVIASDQLVIASDDQQAPSLTVLLVDATSAAVGRTVSDVIQQPFADCQLLSQPDGCGAPARLSFWCSLRALRRSTPLSLTAGAPPRQAPSR
jgi:hypothetical protein